MMRWWLALTLFLSAGAAQAQPVPALWPVRPADLFAGHGLSMQSVDGLAARITVPGDLPGGAAAPLFVDGRLVQTQVLGQRDLYRLPLPLAAIDSAFVDYAPAFLAGEMVTGGRLHLQTRRPDPGPGGDLDYWTGNETGDPGTLRYLEEVPGNVDRLGPDYGLSGTYGWRGGHVRLSTQTRIHFPTDPAVIDRLRPQSTRYPQREMGGAVLEASHAAPLGSVDGWIAASLTRDYLYLESLSRHRIAEVRYGQVSERFVRSLSTEWEAELSLRGSYGGILPSPFEAAETPRLHTIRLHGRALLRSERGWLGGLRAERRDRFGEEIARAGADAVAAFAQVPLGRVRVGAELEYADELFGGAFVRWEEPAPWLASLSAFAEVRRAETGLQELAFREPSVREWLGIEQVAFPKELRDGRWGARAALRLMGSRLHLYARGYPQLALCETEGSETFCSRAEAAGTLLGAELERAFTWKRWSVSAHLAGEAVVDAEERFDARARTRPALRGALQSSYRPATSFTLQGGVRAWSATHWDDERVGAAATLWFAARKSIWRERLAGTVVVQNALDRAYRMVPDGASFPFVLTMRLSAHL